MSTGPTARLAVNARVLVRFLDKHTTYSWHSGTPSRRRKAINGHPVSTNDGRVIRRWRADGKGATVTKAATERILEAHGLTIDEFRDWSHARKYNSTIRGSL